MTYRLKANDGTVLRANFDVEGNTIVFHSRGGSKGVNATNPDYVPALRLLLERLAESGMSVQSAWVDSSRVQELALDQRVILDKGDWTKSPAQLVSLMAGRMQQIGRLPTSKSPNGNATKRIRLALANSVSPEEMLTALSAVPANLDNRRAERPPSEQLHMVNAEHIWRAVEKLRNGFKEHAFEDSTDYDVLLDDEIRLAPKAVFGVAATEALSFEVLPKHFTAGIGSVCFAAIESSGFNIVPKGEHAKDAPAPTDGGRDHEYAEGTPRVRAHLRRERKAGLRQAKLAEFRRLHSGKLYCEECGDDPIAHYNSAEAEACIEVHHHTVQVQHMAENHTTKLEDLRCLCANCHRFVHRLLRRAEANNVNPTS